MLVIWSLVKGKHPGKHSLWYTQLSNQWPVDFVFLIVMFIVMEANTVAGFSD